jgi:hypothetical protein
MKRRAKIMATRLNQNEAEFRSLLISCLRECAAGRWGLFGRNDHDIEARRWLSWPEAVRLNVLAQAIKSAHEEAGTHNDLCDDSLRSVHFVDRRFTANRN